MNETALISIIILLVVIVLIVAGAVLHARNSHKLESYQTTVYDKETRNTMIYTGIFIPMIYYILKVDMGVEVYVDYNTYNNVEIGDSVQVARYSNNQYKLEN